MDVVDVASVIGGFLRAAIVGWSCSCLPLAALKVMINGRRGCRDGVYDSQRYWALHASRLFRD